MPAWYYSNTSVIRSFCLFESGRNFLLFFFFQAEDGIRDGRVTGVQTCALPISNLDAMIAKIAASGAKLLLIGMRAPPNWGADYQRDFDALYPELARAHRVTL